MIYMMSFSFLSYKVLMVSIFLFFFLVLLAIVLVRVLLLLERFHVRYHLRVLLTDHFHLLIQKFLKVRGPILTS